MSRREIDLIRQCVVSCYAKDVQLYCEEHLSFSREPTYLLRGLDMNNWSPCSYPTDPSVCKNKFHLCPFGDITMITFPHLQTHLIQYSTNRQSFAFKNFHLWPLRQNLYKCQFPFNVFFIKWNAKVVFVWYLHVVLKADVSHDYINLINYQTT